MENSATSIISIKKIGIYGQNYQAHYKEDLLALLKSLIENGFEVLIESDFHNTLPKTISENYTAFQKDGLKDIGCLLTVGGDGTVLKSLTFIKNSNTPVIGINFGRLGFLATVQKTDIHILVDALVNNNFIIENRTLIEVVLPNSETITTIPYALNDLSVIKKDSTSMITIDASLDGKLLASYWADGLIISTPTGSTGYSLSCGGPIVHPSSQSFVITPISPHNLNVRSLVIPNHLEITLKVSGRGKRHLVSFDSRMISLDYQTHIKIRKAPFSFPLITLKSGDFFKTLRKKLYWGKDKRN